MIKPDSDYLKGLPEEYFTIPKGKKVDPDTLNVQLQRIDAMVDLFLAGDGVESDKVQDIAFILEGMIYQAKEMAINLECMK